MSAAAIIALSFLTASISVLAVCVFIHERMRQNDRDIHTSLNHITNVVETISCRTMNIGANLDRPREYVLTPRDIEND